MTAEVEAKWWGQIAPNNTLIEKLGLEDIANLNLEKIRKNARKLSNSDPEKLYLQDQHYLKNLSIGSSSIELEKNVRFSDNRIGFGINYLHVIDIEGKNNYTEFRGFMKLLKRYFSGNSREDAWKYNIRIREDKISGLSSLTIKYKQGKADEFSEEYELFTKNKNEAINFCRALGYEPAEESIKSKKQERYSFKKNYIVNIELNEIPEFESSTFLEIEVLPPTLDEAPKISYIYEIASYLGVKIPSKEVIHGGNLENRPYQRLLHLIKN